MDPPLALLDRLIFFDREHLVMTTKGGTMSQAMFDEAEEISVNGKTVKTAATWSLYNPAAMVLADNRSVNLV